MVEALRRLPLEPGVHGYAPIRGLPRTSEAIARRYREVYDVTVDPETEIALLPGTKTGIVELALALCEDGETRCCSRIRTTPTTRPGAALAGAESRRFELQSELGWAPDLDDCARRRGPVSQLSLEPVRGLRAGRRVRRMRSTGRVEPAAPSSTTPPTSTSCSTADDRRASSQPGAKDVGVEMWSMSKTYGMAGWRIGFVVGNAEIVERINLFNDHTRVGVFAPLQAQPSPHSKGRRTRSRERVAALRAAAQLDGGALPDAPVPEGTFYMWVRLPEGLTAETLLVEHRVAVAPARVRARAAPVGRGSPSR